MLWHCAMSLDGFIAGPEADMIGDGTRLYSVPGARHVDLEPVEVEREGPFARLRFRVNRAAAG